MRIAVDVDGVLADQIAPLIPRLKQKYGILIKPDEITSWEYVLSTGTNIRTEIEEALEDPEFLLNMPVVEGALFGMTQLCKCHRVYVATARQPRLAELTSRWLRKHGIPHRCLVSTDSRGKAALDADVLIDDNIENIQLFCESGRHGVLFDRSWNRSMDTAKSARISRALNWLHVLEIVRQIQVDPGSGYACTPHA
ncbi:MAG: hypothetical protein AB1609_19505 [Bacillota bacterium]